MLQTKYSKWLLIHQYLLSIFIPFQSVQEIADNYKKRLAPLLRVRVNISAQWLIGGFVRVLHSKSNLINCAGAGRRTLFRPLEFFPTPHDSSKKNCLLMKNGHSMILTLV
ncbi:hypothetical protein [Streptococcus suis]|uniref:hypothetical protein n=1 Tax=Streptococcus suis TaxID=1307 RepID=UPI00137A69DA|nr:hypothetical protein [Streptococcus suis]MBO3838046.1 hypothetical protein [Streptococcus suis]MBO4113294.1 hypothetical protein [Streptococcus suis]MDG4480051.1 hypothetical protein [Streptococcus suis]MDG4485770.1 hypothetical protein [Streptococcus suis]HEM6509157.1 hypothetical protein [Streptococcus suis]